MILLILQAKLTKENAEFRKIMAEYEYTMEELTSDWSAENNQI
jgi:hypothetical protein